MQELVVTECIELFRFWDLIPAATGAILGAAAAAIPSYMISNKASKEILERDKAARLDDRKMSAHSAMMRLFSITNGLISLEAYLSTCMQKVPNGVDEPDLWRFIPPQTGFVEEELLFSPNELAIFIEGQNAHFSNELWEISHRYIALEGSFKKYCELREKFGALVPANGEGEFLTSELNKTELSKMRPLMASMDSLIKSIVATVGPDCQQAKSLCKVFKDRTVNSLKIEKFPSLKFD
ncbi:hypothetical protein [Thalassospira tepidiphila]|uniref:hypothetical protein n=1 Tax=Thalassospira tepidiphila TaxID=393657 RepID=UPI003AA82086